MGLLLRSMGKFQEAADIHLTIVTRRAYFAHDRAASFHCAGDAFSALNKPLEALIQHHQMKENSKINHHKVLTCVHLRLHLPTAILTHHIQFFELLVLYHSPNLRI